MDLLNGRRDGRATANITTAKPQDDLTGRLSMRRQWSVPIMVTALATLAAAAFVPAPAAAAEYPWCAQYSGEDSGGGRNCGVVSLEQCQLTIRGMGGACEPNTFYTGPAERPVKRVRKRHDG